MSESVNLPEETTHNDQKRKSKRHRATETVSENTRYSDIKVHESNRLPDLSIDIPKDSQDASNKKRSDVHVELGGRLDEVIRIPSNLN